MSSAQKADWIAVDWGTSNLRVWAMNGTNVLARAQAAQGMGALTRDQFGPTLDALIADWGVAPDTPTIACGMVGARQGWAEAPYRSLPCPPLGGTLIRVPDTTRPVHIIPGLKQTAMPDVMRGEETQIAGFLALNPGWDGVICLPGTHTKWAHVSAGEVISFQTFMTGELFALLQDQSVLRHSLQGEGIDDAAFDTALADTLSRPEKLAASLFAIRAGDLLEGTPGSTNRARLSGALIGAELAAAKPYWLGQQIALIGAKAQTDLYARALQSQGAPATLTDAERMTLAGLTAAYRALKEEPS
ncbi:2-dehydro-3-deoxygalactonokinase [Sulfitobacter sp. JB4-11]|uniref:2-dehydro-3-deoxygalactonokinase n=1 Tax=Sulfitobacter rhodophyticola TaxID=3238304 RepID=UPI0035152C99